MSVSRLKIIYLIFCCILFQFCESEINYQLRNLYKKNFSDKDKKWYFIPRVDGQPDRVIDLYEKEGSLELYPYIDQLNRFKIELEHAEDFESYIQVNYAKFLAALIRAARKGISENDRRETKLQYYLVIRYVNPTIVDDASGKLIPNLSSFVVYAAFRKDDASGLISDFKSSAKPIFIIKKAGMNGIKTTASAVPENLTSLLKDKARESSSIWKYSMKRKTRRFLYYPLAAFRAPLDISKKCSLDLLLSKVKGQAAHDFCLYLPVADVRGSADDILLMGLYPKETEVIYTATQTMRNVKGAITKLTHIYRRCTAYGWSNPERLGFRPDLEQKCRESIYSL